jgi:hypothetical protein
MTIIDRVVRSDLAVLYVIDATGDPVLAGVDRAPNCAGVVGVHDRERIERVLQRWSAEIDRRQVSGRGRRHFSDWVLAIDGAMGLRRSLDDAMGSVALSQFERVLAEGPAVGTLWQWPPWNPVVVQRLRWCSDLVVGGCTSLDDPSDGALYGLAASAVPPRFRVGSGSPR